MYSSVAEYFIVFLEYSSSLAVLPRNLLDPRYLGAKAVGPIVEGANWDHCPPNLHRGFGDLVNAWNLKSMNGLALKGPSVWFSYYMGFC